ncbi:MAG TPA: GrpB family protein [Methyloceanibacter sp.]|nr:GrpB family protein [Methyloceanibacter sp.]
MSQQNKLTLAEQPGLFERANAFAEAAIERLQSLLGPESEIFHVGATSVPGCITKGDVDLVVRVEADRYRAARAILDEHYDKNLGSPRDDRFASFADETGTFPLGVQLVTRGSEYDTFQRFTDQLRRSDELRASYNALKRSFVGAEMDDYRKTKADFIEETLVRAAR